MELGGGGGGDAHGLTMLPGEAPMSHGGIIQYWRSRGADLCGRSGADDKNDWGESLWGSSQQGTGAEAVHQHNWRRGRAP